MNFIDLFAGAGGLSEGFIRAGFNPIAHVENDKAACNTLLTRTCYHYLNKTNKLSVYNNYTANKGVSREELYKNLPEHYRKSVINLAIGPDNETIFNIIDELKGSSKIDLIIGGPPCQAYSLAGRSRDRNGMKDDFRNHLYIEYAKFLTKYKPRYFVFENVVGLLSATNKDGSFYLSSMLKLFNSIGYTTEYKVLNSKNFGTLQNRKRVILMGRKGKKPGFYPEFEYWQPDITVSELFGDLPVLKSGQGSIYGNPLNKYDKIYLFESGIRNGENFTTHHIARPHTSQDLEIYKIVVDHWNKYSKRINYNDLPAQLKTHANRKAHLDRFKVVADNLKFTQTIVAHISRDGHYYIHPDKNQNRSLTPREAARIQSFPDNYFFEGVKSVPSRTQAFKQIGNAVPPLMAYGIAKALFKIFNNEKNNKHT